MLDTETTTLDMERAHLFVLDDKLAELNKVAKRYGLEAPTYRVVNSWVVYDPMFDVLPKEWVSVEIIERPLVLDGGWKFEAIIEHTPDGNIVRTAPDASVDTTALHNVDGTCDHCGKVRNRTYTIVVTNEAGEMTRIGKQCVKVYLPAWKLPLTSALFDYLWSLEQLRDASDIAEQARTRGHIDTVDVLEAATRTIAVKGWASKQAEFGTPTSSWVNSLLLAPQTLNDEEGRAFREAVRNVPAEVVELAFTLVANYIAGLEARKDSLDTFENNQLVAYKQGGRKNIGILCWVVEAARRQLEKALAGEAIKKQGLEQATSNYIGSYGEKVTRTATCLTNTAIDTDYGTTSLIVLRTTDGDLIKMFTTAANQPDAGDVIEVTATVKGHEEWKNNKQTVVTRPKFKEVQQ